MPMGLSTNAAQGAAQTEVSCNIELMPNPLGHGLKPASSAAEGRGQLQGVWAHAEATVPAASEAVLDHLKQGD